MPASQFPPLQSKPSSKHCTNCSAKMAVYALPGHYDSTVDVDVCIACNAIWFDQFESIQLSSDGTVALFQLIHEHGSTPATGKFSEGLRCVTCGDGMKLTHDQVKGTRFTYQACRKGHGRFTTFHNFLAEKQFVRELTRAERAKLAATVHQVRCSGCGASVNIGKVDACEYCRAPVSVFDREAAKKAIDHYLQERQRQVPASPGGRRYAGGGQSGYSSSAYDASDLGADILFALGRAATRGLGGAGRAVPVAGASGAAIADSNLEAFPDATSALFGADGGGALADAASGAMSGAAASLSSLPDSFGNSLGGSMSESLPSATDALFGSVASGASDAAGGLTGEIAGALGDAASSGLGETVGDIASSAGGGVVDLVVDGIGSLLGSIFD